MPHVGKDAEQLSSHTLPMEIQNDAASMETTGQLNTLTWSSNFMPRYLYKTNENIHPYKDMNVHTILSHS